MRDTASKTLVTVHQQGQQIHRTHMMAVDIDQDLSRVTATTEFFLLIDLPRDINWWDSTATLVLFAWRGDCDCSPNCRPSSKKNYQKRNCRQFQKFWVPSREFHVTGGNWLICRGEWESASTKHCLQVYGAPFTHYWPGWRNSCTKEPNSADAGDYHNTPNCKPEYKQFQKSWTL